MERLRERARTRLRPGESVATAVPLGENGVVVTSQRLLAFAPEGEGRNFRAIELPNVEGARLRTVGDPDWLSYVVKGGLAGVVGVGIGLTVDFGDLVSLGGIDTSGAGRIGVGDMVRILTTISTLLAKLDDALLVGGLLGLALALGALGMYVESRTHTLVVAVAGAEDLQVPAPADADEGVDRLRQALYAHEDDAAAGGRAESPAGDDPLGPRAE
ncbi:MAG: hypothetical protein ABEJ31_09915 [Haloarculaceae archaeon]